MNIWTGIWHGVSGWCHITTPQNTLHYPYLGPDPPPPCQAYIEVEVYASHNDTALEEVNCRIECTYIVQ